MKAISIWQPWASLIALGHKRIETRGWSTGHRGPLLIHAAKKWDDTIEQMCHGLRIELGLCGITDPASLPRGVAVCVVDLLSCRAVEDLPPGSTNARERALGDYSPGRFAWQLGNVRRFRVTPQVIGKQGLFDVPDSITSFLEPTA